ncbi:galactose mutarotase [Halalkalibacterium halodurans]|uniref:Aldose 1-epimerase n=1 Tax=Halalkalibacterium halodurans (strain ATCC BAA-125 / DSM 18197 / FERM 7344 / JCM 9153 / C-125) TaxID=272558 RepID=Q9K995_HALH5|nr:aldose epimerase family protein [Halalkalibacterium halodurans]MED4080258.1 galactose mutarotase [Halalkalibacterium halodurans]MED4084674.1 galactose mutarotase [Halalkalibacterium halodurans]MED4103946.1 galactose mutarotase [Halalkalibacterium halodurans]MED4108982.1 galactose mutarotase [Halalkalibacterium halodurans]MED4122613.1 galactose mutarotase [Halalkalibacterium halodurans]
MQITTRIFAETNGESVRAFTMTNDHGMEVTCIEYGCIITELKTPDRHGNLENIVLGFDRMDDYEKHSQYFGAVIGRVAGRIANGEFMLDNQSYTLANNEGENHLHGGEKGFDKVVWKGETIDSQDEVGVEFSYISRDGEEGYPGTLSMSVRYILNNDNELKVMYSGKADQKTLVNVTNHSYFNLSGNLKRDILEHELTLKSSQFLQLNDQLLPTGTVLDVVDTPFDFRNGRKIIDGTKATYEQNVIVGNGYDHPFKLDTNLQQEIRLVDEESGRCLEMETTEPCVVLYTGNALQEGVPIRGVRSRKYLALCLETQGFPDAIHHPDLPSIVLEEGEEYLSTTTYRFRTV